MGGLVFRQRVKAYAIRARRHNDLSIDQLFQGNTRVELPGHESMDEGRTVKMSVRVTAEKEQELQTAEVVAEALNKGAELVLNNYFFHSMNPRPDSTS